jgi:hypothetical protein
MIETTEPTLFELGEKVRKKKQAKVLPMIWIPSPIWVNERLSLQFDCPFCGLHTDEWHIDLHLSECEEAVKLKLMLGERFIMKLDASVVSRGPVATHQFLRARNIPSGRAEATIVAFRQADASMPYSDYLLDVQLGKTIFTQGLRERNEDFIRLAKKFGLDTDAWIKKTVVVFTEKYINASGTKSDIVRVSPK